MATDQGFIEFLVDQMNDAGGITFRKMFGEYAVYCDGKVVALVCDNQLFVKPTEGGKAYIKDSGPGLVEAPPYPGAKLYFLIEDRFEDREWISEIIRITAKELPDPKPRPKSKNRRSR
jgi:TfoX/Sxy family transcriptional regulator of competence genes